MLCNVVFLNLVRQLLPNIELELFKIHPLRLVPISLTHELYGPNQEPMCGLLCIDQARHLFPLRPNDPAQFELPVIGM